MRNDAEDEGSELAKAQRYAEAFRAAQPPGDDPVEVTTQTVPLEEAIDEIPRINSAKLQKELEEKYRVTDEDFKNPKRYYGIVDGIDDPRDAPWRLQGEDLIRQAVARVSGVKLYDISWNIDHVQVFVEPNEGSEGPVDMKLVVECTEEIHRTLEPHEEELQILSRHHLEVSSPGAADVLSTDREFEAFKGFDVIVKVWTPKNFKAREPVEGKLVRREVHDTVVSVKGKEVRIPNQFVEEVRLPKARQEKTGSSKKKSSRR